MIVRRTLIISYHSTYIMDRSIVVHVLQSPSFSGLLGKKICKSDSTLNCHIFGLFCRREYTYNTMTRKCVRILLCLLTYSYIRNERAYTLRVRNFILLQMSLPHIRRVQYTSGVIVSRLFAVSRTKRARVYIMKALSIFVKLT